MRRGFVKSSRNPLREKFETFVHPHGRFRPHSLEFLVAVLLGPERTFAILAVEVDVNEHDQVDETIVGANGEQDRMIDRLRVVDVALRGRRQIDEVLLETLNGLVDLIENGPEVPKEGKDRGASRATSCETSTSQYCASQPSRMPRVDSRFATWQKTR